MMLTFVWDQHVDIVTVDFLVIGLCYHIFICLVGKSASVVYLRSACLMESQNLIVFWFWIMTY